MNNPYFTVVLPTYNREQFIGEAIESVILQTNKDWELLIVNDASLDETTKVIDNYRSESIKIFNLSDNRGVSNARNIALENARGKYVAFLDDDDLFEPSFLQDMKDQIEFDEDQYDFYWSGIGYFNNIDSTDKVIQSEKIWSVDSKIKKENLLLLKKIAVSYGVIINLASLRKVGFFDKNFISSEDKDLFMRMIEMDFKYKAVPKMLVLKRSHDFSQLSHNSDDAIRVTSAEMIINKHSKFLEINPYLLKMFKLSLARKYYRAKRIHDARKVLRELFMQFYDFRIIFKWVKLEIKYR